MRKLILTFTLPLIVFLFSLAPNAGAERPPPPSCFDGPVSADCSEVPEGVKSAYYCELDCPRIAPCGQAIGDGPQCNACDQLDLAFPCVQLQPICSKVCAEVHDPPL